MLRKHISSPRREILGVAATGRPALYDNAIDTDYTHSIGIQKGQI
ncbi:MULTISPECIES: hypothetical protein [Corynebacterium]|nr:MULTISPECIES: hypothetical protein [Corynebacterium]